MGANPENSDSSREPHDSRLLSSPSLVSGLKRGDQTAWETFSRLWGQTLLLYFQRAGLSTEDAEEVRQNVMIKVFRGIKGFQRDGARLRLRYWIYDIARKELYTHRARYINKPQSPGGSDFLKVSHEQPAPSVDDDSASQQSFDAVLMSHILQRIEADFEPHVWRAFWLSVIDQRTGPEIAAELGIQANAVRQAVFRVKKRIQWEQENVPTDSPQLP